MSNADKQGWMILATITVSFWAIAGYCAYHDINADTTLRCGLAPVFVVFGLVPLLLGSVASELR